MHCYCSRNFGLGSTARSKSSKPSASHTGAREHGSLGKLPNSSFLHWISADWGEIWTAAEWSGTVLSVVLSGLLTLYHLRACCCLQCITAAVPHVYTAYAAHTNFIVRCSPERSFGSMPADRARMRFAAACCVLVTRYRYLPSFMQESHIYRRVHEFACA